MDFVMTIGLNDDARAIREEVFMREQGYVDEFDDIDARAAHIVLYQEGEACGCCRYFERDKSGEWALGRLAVRKKFRRRGLAEALIAKALEGMRSRGARSAYLDAQTYVRGLYEKFGFVQCGEEFLEEGNPHVPMRKIFA